MTDDIFVGVDISKAWLDTAQCPTPGSEQTCTLPARLDNSEQGRAGLVERLKQLKPALVVLEATGGFEAALAAALSAQGIAVAVVNPKRVRDFARAAGILAKTDKLDAQVLAQFAQRMRPQAHPLPDETQQEITELVDRRAQLVVMRAQEKTRLATVKPIARKSVREHITWLDKRIGDIERDLHGRLKASPVYQPKYALLDSVPGVGSATVALLLGRMPELGTLSSKRIAALVGLAPFADDSGKRRGQRYVQGGRADVRCGLYMAALTASQRNPVIKAMYQRLRARGKPFKVAITACMRKLLVILNAIVRTGTPWKDLTISS